MDKVQTLYTLESLTIILRCVIAQWAVSVHQASSCCQHLLHAMTVMRGLPQVHAAPA